VSLIDKRQAAVGILFWVLIFGAFITLAGIGDFIETLGAISSTDMVYIFLAVSGGVFGMGSCLYVINRNLELGGGWLETVFLNTSVSLAHNLTPFGQVGGAPIGAVILSKRWDGDYEKCLAALSMKDLVSFTPAILVFTFGGGYLVLYEQTIPERVRPLLGAFTVFVFTIVAATVVVYKYPEYIHGFIHRLVAGLNRLAIRLPLVPSIEPAEVARRVDNFSESIGQVAADKPTVVAASGLATFSFVSQGLLLWVTLGAVGVEIPAVLAVFIVPVSLLASGLPLPGGSGGVESVQILMIVATVGASSTETITAVVLSRGLVFWTPIVLGSLTLLVLQLQGTFDAVPTE
jgi:uncharacterized protein (TIRG00374 family)